MKTIIIAMAIASLLQTHLVRAEEPWTLEQSVRRMYQVAPELRAARARTLSRQVLIAQADNWPNPSVTLVVDEKLAKSQGNSGFDFREFELSQPLPISGRLGDRRAVAEADYQRLGAKQAYIALEQEYKTANLFHDLQLAAAHLHLATRRFDAADRFSRIAKARFDQGDLSRLAMMRLQLAREQAHQRFNDAEGEYEELVTRYRAFLALDDQRPIPTAALHALAAPAPIETYLERLPTHPAQTVEQFAESGAQAQLELARANRYHDIVLKLGQETERFGGVEDEVTRLGVTIPLPLWDQNSGNIAQAQHQIDGARQKQRATARDLKRNLIKAHTHLRHLITQAEHHKAQVLDPSQRVYELTQVSFESGEVDILELIDAYHTYFSAQDRYQQLLHQGWLEMADLRLAAALSLVRGANPGESTR